MSNFNWNNTADLSACLIYLFIYISGSALLVHPVTEQSATSVTVYLPEGIWYDFYTYKTYASGLHDISVGDDTVSIE